MKFSIVSFTENGMRLSERIREAMDTGEVFLYTKCSFARENSSAASIRFIEEPVGDWTGKQMEEKNGLLFIGACGIAVRAVAPYVADKLSDSPVLVMDEKGKYIIPILSGHMGGANEFAGKIAERTGAIPVITTATDLNGRFAVDLFAKKNGLFLVNREGIAKVSSKVLAGKEITIAVEQGHIAENEELPEGIRIVTYPPGEPVDVLITTKEAEEDALLVLRPREYAIGIGCKKGKEAEKIEAFLCRNLKSAGITKEQIFALASIDRKKEEEGLLAWSRKEKIPFLTFSAEQLQEVEGSFHASAFVENQVGVDNVCERAALRACGRTGKLCYEKHAEDGMTIAIAGRDWSVTFEK